MPFRSCYSPLPPFFCILASLVVFCFPASAQSGRAALVSRVSIAKTDPLELGVETSGQVSPQTQVISNPERLVIDIPMTVPGPALRNLPVNRGGVKQVRVSLFSTTPAVTRLVVDLRQPQGYQIVPNGSGFRIRLGTDEQSAAPEPTAEQTVGWVSSQLRTVRNGDRPSAPLVTSLPRGAQPDVVNGVNVQFINGLLSIHSAGATLSEILFQVQKKTGAEIAIPAGTERQQVAADFGPGRPSEVLRQLLDGSGLNFVFVGSETDPSKLRSVILSPKTEEVSSPESFAAPETPSVVYAPFEPPAVSETAPQPQSQTQAPDPPPEPTGDPQN